MWCNDLAFKQRHLEQNGFYVSGERNNWAITEAGKESLRELCVEASTEFDLIKITSKSSVLFGFCSCSVLQYVSKPR